MYDILYTKQFKKDLKLCQKQNLNLSKIKKVIDLLATGKPLPSKYHDHNLSGNYSGFRECHIAPDWLLIYLIDNSRLILTLTRTGSHSQLF